MFAMGSATAAAAAVAPATKPAVLFLSHAFPDAYGGADIKGNLARLDDAGYRVAWYAFETLDDLPPATVQPYDVVVMLTPPPVDWQGTRELTPASLAQYEELRKLLRAGGGLMMFMEPGEFASRALMPFCAPYGLVPPVGAFADDAPTIGVYDTVNFAYTTDIVQSPLTEGVRGLWYPVGGKSGGRFDFDTLRNANTTPIRLDASWQPLVRVGATTRFVTFEGNDSTYLSQPVFAGPPAAPAPLVAVREKVEGLGRLAVCGISPAYSDFIAGNTTYGGVCTGRGLEGKSSDLDRLLMNVLDWLAEPSRAVPRETIAASLEDTFARPSHTYGAPGPANADPALLPNFEQFQGVVGVRSVYSGGQSTVAEYAAVARELGLDYLAFLEDFATLKPEAFDRFQKECAELSDDKLLLIPGIRVDNELGIHYFGFRTDLLLPQPSHLKPGTKLLTQREAGQYQWARSNGAREGMACGNYRLDNRDVAGIPASDYNVLNPFISIYTYRNGKLSDSMLGTYLTCAARTEWVSPIAIHLVDSATGLREAREGGGFQTVWLRPPGEGLAGMKKSIGDTYGFVPATYVTSGPVIEEWRSTAWDTDAGWFEWTRYRWLVRMVVSSPAGLKEIRVLNGTRPFRRFLPGGARRFEHTLVLTHNDMHNLILHVTDNDGGRAVSDEEWDKNQLLQLTWCADRNNMLAYAGLPAPKAASGTTAENWPAPSNLEKGGFRETLVPFVNADRSHLPMFDGQPFPVARVSPAPVVYATTGAESGDRIAREIGRDLSSPDVAIQTAGCRLIYPPSVKKVHPWTRGPLEPTKLFEADLRYITFSHQGHLPAPVILEGTLRIKQDLQCPADLTTLPVQVADVSVRKPAGGYRLYAISNSADGNHSGMLSYQPEVPASSFIGAFNRGTVLSYYPSTLGAVSLISLDDKLNYHFRNTFSTIGYDLRGQSLKAGTELKYRLLVFVGPFDEPPNTDLVESFCRQLGIADPGRVSYVVNAEQGNVTDQQYVLTVDGQGQGFAGEITLPANFPTSLPIMVTGLNDKWTSVLYERDAKRFRPLGMHDSKAYCHRTPEERGGKIFIGHPFTLDRSELWLSAVQTRERAITLQIHNPTDQPVSAQVRRSPFFDFVVCEDFSVDIPPGSTVERRLP